MEDELSVLLRYQMIESQIKARGVKDEKVIKAFMDVPRHMFVRPGDQKWAYTDHPLAIGCEQTISQPYIVAYMTEKLQINKSHRVLEIGTGSGYQTAILAHLASIVYSVERIEVLQKRAKDVLDKLELTNICYKLDDGHYGWDAFGPYDAILVSAAAKEVPLALVEQLKMGGKMILPVGETMVQTLILVTKTKDGFDMRKLFGCRFVPLIEDR